MTQRLSPALAAHLTRLLELPPASLEAIISKLGEIPAKPFQKDDVANAISLAQISSSDASEIAGSILQLYWGLIQSRKTVQDFASEVADSPDLKDLSPDKKPGFQQCLIRLLGLRPIYVGQNALSLIYDNERVLSQARIISDLRPVYGPKVEEGPAGAIIVHTLKLEYQTISGPAEFFLALTVEGIESLLNTVQRAKEKDANLRTVYKMSFFS